MGCSYCEATSTRPHQCRVPMSVNLLPCVKRHLYTLAMSRTTPHNYVLWYVVYVSWSYILACNLRFILWSKAWFFLSVLGYHEARKTLAFLVLVSRDCLVKRIWGISGMSSSICAPVLTQQGTVHVAMAHFILASLDRRPALSSVILPAYCHLNV